MEEEGNLMKFQYEKRHAREREWENESLPYIIYVYAHKHVTWNDLWAGGALQPLTDRKGIYDEKFLFN